MRITLLLLLLLTNVAQAAETIHNSQYGTRVSVTTKCPVKGGEQETAFIAAALASVLPSLIDKAVDWAAAAAKVAGEAKMYPAETGIGYVSMLKSDGAGTVVLDKNFGCVVVTSADFGTAIQGGLTGNWKSETLTGFGFARDPRFYLEMKVVRSRDGHFFALKPTFLYFREPSKDSWATTSIRDLSLSLSFTSPSEKEPFASTILVFKKLIPVTEMDLGSVISPMTSGYMPIHPVDETIKNVMESEKAAATKYEKAQGSDADAIKAIAKGSDSLKRLNTFQGLATRAERLQAMGYSPLYAQKLKAVCDTAEKHKKSLEHCPDEMFWADEELRYVAQLSQEVAAGASQARVTLTAPTVNAAALGTTNIQATIVESRDGNEFMKLVGEVLDGSKADLKKSITSTLPSERAKAKEEEANANEEKLANQEALQILAAIELGKVRKLEAELAQETEPIKKIEIEANLLAAKLRANQAYRKAGKVQPFSVGL